MEIKHEHLRSRAFSCLSLSSSGVLEKYRDTRAYTVAAKKEKTTLLVILLIFTFTI